MKIEEMLDIFDIDEIEKMSPEECKGLLKGFFIGAVFTETANKGIDELIDRRYKEKKMNTYKLCTPLHPDRQKFRHIRLEFENREDPQDVLDDLREILKLKNVKYAMVSDLYSLADLPTTLEMNDWGWDDLEDCTIERWDGNYILKMPPAELIPREDRISIIS